MPGLPAAAIDTQALNRYKKHFGDHYYSFTHLGCLFITLNTSLINCPIEQADEQQRWLEQTLQTNTAKRIFLFLHYPLFIHSEAEAEHYDNIAEPGRSWLLGIIRQYRIELVLSGHVHQYFYNRVDQCCLYTMPPTSFTRQDYAELFKVEAAAEHGRDDIDKYSVALIDVYETGHKLQIIPTHGKTLPDPTAPTEEPRETQTNTKRKNITVHLRHAWHESVDLPYNGPMEEFSRKRARNDYVFMRLQQMGIQDVRIPLQDIIDATSKQRVQDYIATGFRFHAFCLQQQQVECLTPDTHLPLNLLTSLEYISTTVEDTLALRQPALPAGVSDLPLLLGHAKTGAHQSSSGKPFAHSVSSGFQWDDHNTVLSEIANWSVPVQGIVFQIPWEADLTGTLKKMQKIFSDLPFKCIANIRLANANPATANFDDDAILDRIKNAVQYSADLDNLELQLDTTMDIDRGYSPRHGLINRLGNLRPAGRWLCGQHRE